MCVCEIRLPTYKRPIWLRRALESVLAQDYPHWRVIVMDDSPEQEGRDIIAAVADERISYRSNVVNLGTAGNLDQAFTPTSLVGGHYACTLEDDNWLMPTFLSENIKALEKWDIDILLRNQEIWQQSENQTWPTGRTTRGDWFEERVYQHPELHAHLFLFEGVSNGGLFWKTTIKSNLQVGSTVTDPGLQEHCRTLQIVEPLGFAALPLCVWSSMPNRLSTRNIHHRRYGRGRQSIGRYLLRHYDYSFIETVEKLATKLEQTEHLNQMFLQTLYFRNGFNKLCKFMVVQDLFKAYAKYLLIPDPLEQYFQIVDKLERNL